MGVKRPLKPQVAAKYGEELAQAEQLSKAGFNPKTKELDPNIYGPTNVSFNPVEEMEVLRKNNVTDDSFLNASLKEFNTIGSNTVQDALTAVQAEDPSFPVPEFTSAPAASEQPPQETKEEEQVKDTEGPVVPDDPEERLVWVAEQLAKVKPGAPNVDILREWKRTHGNVYILQIDDYVFIYRYLKRQEWAQLQANEAFHKLRADQQEDHIAERCTLWPKFNPHTKGALPAGAAPMLAEQIRIQSMFLDPLQVANITIKL